MPSNSDNKNKTAQSSSSNAERGALVLLALGEAGIAGLALKDIAARTGNAKPALHRTLVALGRHGFVERAQGRGRYRLGPAIYALSRRQNSAREKVELWRPALREISDRLGFTTFFTERAGLDSIVLDLQMGSEPVQMLVDGVGGRLPLGTGPGSAAILARLDPPTRESILASNAQHYHRNGMDPASVRAMVTHAAATGFALSSGEIFAAFGGIGVAICDRDGSTTSAITASTLLVNLTPEVVARSVALIQDVIRKTQQTG
ncbi:MAG TPA: helix-turn-helix domain-containing protein [Acetobacteraceae bacterium]